MTVANQFFDHRKYRPITKVSKQDRRWPDQQIVSAPTWCSVDLRDGNQALVEPMNPEQKLEMFKLLVDVGFKEIEVGFPAASLPDFEFVRQLIEQELIPDDVTIQVLTQAREELIARSFEALRGANKAIVHLYNSTSTVQREQVFKMSKEEVKGIAVQGAKWVEQYAQAQSETKWQFQYSPESFTNTEVGYAIEVCNAVIDVWKPTPSNKVVINLPATVEVSTPNVYADQVELVCDEIANRDSLIISLHTHNDRGCGVAAAELGVMAGADRLEGTLLGNGERTGNMDVVTAAMNLYSQGIDPELNLSNMDRIISTVERCTGLPLSPRHAYAGELVFSAFSGSHQDAINKSLAIDRERRKEDSLVLWDVPYLPIDPRDLGRSYQEVIRINSQSGKGGVAYLMEQNFGLQLPRWLQVDFSQHVQQYAEVNKSEVSSDTIYSAFSHIYMANTMSVTSYKLDRSNDIDSLDVVIEGKAGNLDFSSSGIGVLDALIAGLKNELAKDILLIDYCEHTLGQDVQSEAMAYVQLSVDGSRYCGAGKSQDIVGATLQAVMNALVRSF